MSPFHGWSGEDQAVHLPIFKGGDGHGHGQVGFTRSGWTYAKDHLVFSDGLDVAFLAHGFTAYGLSSGGKAHRIGPKLTVFLLFPPGFQGDDIIGGVLIDHALGHNGAQHFFYYPHR